MHRPSLIRTVLLACGLLLAAACSAHNDAGGSAPVASSPAPQFTEGNQYITLKPRPGQPAPHGPVVLLEVFSYGCPHCAEFVSYMNKLRAQLPKGVEVRYMPAVFNQAWVPFAQAFYAARELGVLQQTHDQVFAAKLEHYPLNSLEDMADFYARHGVDRARFMAAATSQATSRQMDEDMQTEFTWGVDSTPTLVVGRLQDDRKDAPFVALMRSKDATSYAELQQVGAFMVQRALEH